MQSLTEIWKQVLTIIKPEFASNQVGYNTWIESIIPVELKDNNLLVSVPYDFNREMITTRYYSLIKNALDLVTGESIEITIKLNSEEIKKTSKYSSNLNPSYLFDNFIIGKSNQLAHATAFAIAEGRGEFYNPFFLYGGVGLGKTHLMHAIGNYMIEKHPDKKILYVSSEKFTNDMINAIKNSTTEDFREKYRTLDLLLIDDIQFIWDKEATQEEFFHTFNELYQNAKYIVITSDRHPKDLQSFMDRLVSRFEQGPVIDINPPDYETRIAILQKKANQLNINIPQDVYEFVASKIKSNIRELEGAIKKIMLFHQLSGNAINTDLAKEALKDILNEKKQKITPKLVIEKLEKHFNLKEGDLTSKSRSQSIVFPRQIAMFILKDYTDLSLKQIAAAVGVKDHTTVMYGRDKIKESMESDSSVKNLINDIIKDIKN